MADEFLPTLWKHRLIAEVTSPRRTLLGCSIAAAQGGLKLLALPASYPDVAQIAAELGDLELLIGISRVVASEQVAIAIAAGADFVISPVCDPELIQQCRQHGLAVIAGAGTVTEVHRAWRYTPDGVAIYPAAHLGGPPFLKLLAREFPEIPICAIGGVDVEIGPAYLEAGASAIILDKGLFPMGERDADSEAIITARTSALVELCSELGLSEAISPSSPPGLPGAG